VGNDICGSGSDRTLVFGCCSVCRRLTLPVMPVYEDLLRVAPEAGMHQPALKSVFIGEMDYLGCDELNFDLATSSFPWSGSTSLKNSSSQPPVEIRRMKK